MKLDRETLKLIPEEERAGVVFKEYVKCKKDVKYCIQTYLTVKAKSKRVPFKLFPHQIEMVDAYENYTQNISMKTRQMGFTTGTAAYLAWVMATKNNQIIKIVSKSMTDSQKFLKEIRDMLDDARKNTCVNDKTGASWLIPDFDKTNNNKRSFTLTTGSVVIAEATTEDAGRGDTLNYLVVDEAAAIDRRNPEKMAEIWSAAGIALTNARGKAIIISCVTKDTYVFSDNGIQQIEDFIPLGEKHHEVKDFEIKEYNILGNKEKRKGTIFHVNGLTKTKKIKTTYAQLEGSFEHKVWAYKNGKFDWFKFKDLDINCFVNVQYGMNVWGNKDDVSDFKVENSGKYKQHFCPKSLTPDICYLLGLYLSEGYACDVFNKNKEIIGGNLIISCGDDISKIFKDLGFNYCKSNKGVSWSVGSRDFISFMKYLGFDLNRKANNKEIPKRLLSISEANMKALLQGIFDGDGCAGNTGHVGINLSSKKIIEQLRIILLNFGILSMHSIVSKEQMNSYKGTIPFNYDGHRLEIVGFYASQYFEKIGFRLPRKQIRHRKLLVSKNHKSPMPGFQEMFKKILAKYNFTTYFLRKKGVGAIEYKQENITQNKFGKLLDCITTEIGEDDFLMDLKDKTIGGNSLWCKINSIEESENETFDFSLPNNSDSWCHSVIYNGILGHQTPKGMSGWYYDQYTNAQEIGWNVIDAHWIRHPEYSLGTYQWISVEDHPEGGYIKWYNTDWPKEIKDPKTNTYKELNKSTYAFVLDGKIRSPWYDNESKALGPRRTKCELDCSFAGTGGEVIDADLIRELKLYADSCSFTNPFESLGGIYRKYKEFLPYNESHKYLISADVATGDGSDYSTFVVFDLTTLEICATYKDQLLPETFALILAAIGKRFGSCQLVVENAGGGGTTLQELKRQGYANIYYSILNKKDPSTGMKKRKIGLWPSEDVRWQGGDKLESVIRLHQMKIPCSDIIEELYTWIWDKDGKRRHAPEKNDDLLMALQHGIWYRYFVFVRGERNKNNFKAIFEVQRGNKRLQFSDSPHGRGTIIPVHEAYVPNDMTKKVMSGNLDNMIDSRVLTRNEIEELDKKGRKGGRRMFI